MITANCPLKVAVSQGGICENSEIELHSTALITVIKGFEAE